MRPIALALALLASGCLTDGLQEQVIANQQALDALYAACRDATPGTDEARRACMDYEYGREQHEQFMQAVHQQDAYNREAGQRMQQQGIEMIRRGMNPEPPPSAQNPSTSCTSWRDIYGRIQTRCY